MARRALTGEQQRAGEVRAEDPGGADVRALLGRHLAFAHEHTPPEHVHALDLEALREPAVTFFALRRDGELLAVAALKQLDAGHAEIKSMHTAEAARGQGLARAMVEHLVAVARARGVRRLSLETGTMAAFAPARALYATMGFAPCGPFGDYRPSHTSAFMTLELPRSAMRKLVVTEFVSLDGVMEAPGGEPGYAHSGWVGPLFSDELGAYKLDEQLAADVLLLGRRTYESFHGAWPERDGAMADKINTMTKVVASTTLGSSPWHDTTVVASGVAERVAELKQAEGGPILLAGSRVLAHDLFAAGLVDELHLQVFPLLLGSGARFAPESEATTALELVHHTATPNGVLLQEYRVAGA